MDEGLKSVCFFKTWNVLNFIIRHLEENLDDWLTEELNNYMDDDYLVFDCPGLRHSLVCALACIV